MVDREAWMEFAECRKSLYDPEWFFPKSLDSWRAKQVCGVCAVRPECLAYALKIERTFNHQYGPLIGVWGGTTPPERAKMMKARR